MLPATVVIYGKESDFSSIETPTYENDGDYTIYTATPITNIEWKLYISLFY